MLDATLTVHYSGSVRQPPTPLAASLSGGAKGIKMRKIEYRVRPVTRYIVTRFESDGTASNGGSCVGRGEYDNAATAYEVGYALCKAEHEKLGWEPGDERIQYPQPIAQIAAPPLQAG